MLAEFRKFIMRGNVLDLAIGVIIGAAFGSIVKSLVDDIIMPPIGLLLGGVNFTDLFLNLTPAKAATTLAQAKELGAATINYGVFVNAVIQFLIIVIVLFLIIRTVNAMKEQPAPAAPNTKECPQCATTIPLKAVRCPNCTSEL
jgi:large conductance mechanosensitive channel